MRKSQRRNCRVITGNEPNKYRTSKSQSLFMGFSVALKDWFMVNVVTTLAASQFDRIYIESKNWMILCVSCILKDAPKKFQSCPFLFRELHMYRPFKVSHTLLILWHSQHTEMKHISNSSAVEGRQTSLSSSYLSGEG